MKILQWGYTKSGNFWLYNIIDLILFEANIEKKSFIKSHPKYNEISKNKLSYNNQADIDNILIENDKVSVVSSSIFKEKISDFDGFLDQTTHVWSHSTWTKKSAEIYKKFDKIVYVARDPRDVCISMSKFHFTDYGREYLTSNEKNYKQYLSNRLPGLLLSWVNNVGYHLFHQKEFDIYIIFFENLLLDVDKELRSLIKYLGVHLSEDQIESIKNKISFQTMKKDNPSHVRKGGYNKWPREFNDSQKNISLKITSKLLKILNYSENDIFKAPKINFKVRSEILDAINFSKGSIIDKIKYSAYLFKSKKPFLLKLKQGFKFIFKL